MSSEGSTDTAGACACGEARISVARLLVSFVRLGLRTFFVAVARRDVWRLPVFFVVSDASEFGAG